MTKNSIAIAFLTLLLLALLHPYIIDAQTPTPAATDSAGTSTSANVQAEQNVLDALVEETLSSMSVADRVGQLFLITFSGNDIGFESDIAELVYGYRVGGVVISPANDNFSNGAGVDTPRQVAALVNRLQGLAYGVLLTEDKALDKLPEGWQEDKNLLLEELTEVAPVNLPLFIGLVQLGDNLPDTALRRGFTPLPSQMAIGAAWNASLAQDVGQVVGEELDTVGVNMLLGPNLDVLDRPQAGPLARIGVHMYGGSPYWVGRLGQAYIAGVQQGSNGGIATIVGHFPGAGNIDRLPDEEVSTVQRPLEELEQIALPPFRAVTGNAPGATVDDEAGEFAYSGTTDGMMSSLARYSAFQGSSLGRNTPIGLAPELELVLAQEGFEPWRSAGGILVSAELGAPAIRRLYTLSPSEVPYRRIALDAFTAGHDLLYLGRFSSDDAWESQRMNIKETIGFFQERYVDDPDFAQDVDDRVRRILKLKFRLYGVADDRLDMTNGADGEVAPFTPIAFEEVLATEEQLELLGSQRDAALATMSQVARESVGILYPDPREANEVLSRIPQKGESILIFTDSRLMQECADCVVDAAIDPDMLESTIYRLYGPDATDQLAGDEITSLAFSDLQELLDAETASSEPPQAIPTVTPSPTLAPQPEPTLPEEETNIPVPPLPAGRAGDELPTPKNEKTARLIEDADWILFAMLDVDVENYPESGALNKFLRLHSDELASKTVVVFALNAPHFLDATEISKLNAYYGVYGKTQPFLEDAVRALFRSYTPDAAPPVSVAGTRYSSLSERLEPDPTRTIPLTLSDSEGLLEASAGDSGEETEPMVDEGEPLQMTTGTIYDRNGNHVGDGQSVEFVLTFNGDDTARRIQEGVTRAGVATTEMTLDRPGLLEVVARAGGASSGEPRRIMVEADPSTVGVTTEEAIEGTTEESSVGVEEADAVAMAPPSEVQAATTSANDPALVVEGPAPISLASLFIALLTISAMVSMLLIVQVRIMPRRTLLHSILWAVNCGLFAYILYAFGFVPGAEWLQASLRIWGSAVVVIIAMLLPLLWLQLRSE